MSVKKIYMPLGEWVIKVVIDGCEIINSDMEPEKEGGMLY